VSAAWRTHEERSTVGTLRLMVWIALHLGRGVARALLLPICLYFLLLAPRARRASRAYLDAALGRRARWTDVYRHLHCFASTILDRVYLLNGRDDRFAVNIVGEDIAHEIVASGRGHIFIGAHLGSFEIMHTVGRVHGGLQTWMVMYEENARKVTAVLRSINPDFNAPVIGLGHIDSMLRIKEALARGECVGLLADRGLHDEKTLDCQFFGRPMPIPLGPFRLALMLGQPVVLTFGLYLGGNRYEVHFERLADGMPVDRAQREAVVAQWAQTFAARLEHHCRQHPYNWFNFFDVWRS